MNEKERNYNLQKRLIEFAVGALNVVSWPDRRVYNRQPANESRSGSAA